ncbi:MAG: bifunctional enzyme CysN/CysC [Chloroflexi bacterium]|nr:MAG: bifunctional enzyme CysN/CysC [Chloroflexota bacterium]
MPTTNPPQSAPANAYGASDLLRFSTAGSVDDGKSTLIGRLLYDAKQTFDDQVEAIERTSKARGDAYVDLALLTDGLRAEREQGITIDVAYRYFQTPRRKFILADTPGHVQYTRNMVTGASTADLALILVDARHGLMEQTRRHASLATLLGITHLVLCVNKMDLVDYQQAVFDRIVTDFQELAAKLRTTHEREIDVRTVPISALVGDNIVDRSDTMHWYQGPTLLERLETVDIARDNNLEDGRLPVQLVIRPVGSDYRGYAGVVAGGILRPGDAVTVLPSGLQSTIRTVEIGGVPIASARPPLSVTVTLADDLDISRGDLICHSASRPEPRREFDAMICWMSEAATLTPGRKLAIKHTTRNARVVVDAIMHRLDVNTLAPDPSLPALALNDIGRVRLRSSAALFPDAYKRNRATGSFILVDEATSNTVAAGMVLPNH